MLVDEKRRKMHDSLLQKIEELGRKPTSSEVLLDPNMAQPNDYAYYYGSFDNAVEEIWGEYSFKGNTIIRVKKPINNLGRDRA